MKKQTLKWSPSKSVSANGEVWGAKLTRGALSSAVVQASASAVALLLGIILARVLGPDGYGIYAYSYAILSLVLVVAEGGVPTLLMREVAAAQARARWGVLRGAIRRGQQFVGVVSMIVMAIGFSGLSLNHNALAPETLLTMSIMLLVVPGAAYAKTVAHALRGLNKIVIGQVLELLLRPLIVVFFVIAMLFFLPDILQPSVVMAGQLASVVVISVVSIILLKRSIPMPARGVQPEFSSGEWFKSSMRFVLIGGALAINSQTDIVMLGWFASADIVGNYRVAVQAAVLVVFPLTSVAAAAAPAMSKLNAKGELESLKDIVRKSTRAIAMPASIIAAVLIFQGDTVISSIFGTAYTSAAPPLAVLAIGQLVVAVLGISGPLLSMSGFERQITYSILVGAISNMILNLLLIPHWGEMGAAVATAITLSGWSIYLVWFSFSRMNITVLSVVGLNKHK